MKRPNGSGTIVKLKGNRRKPYVVRVPDRDSRGHVIQRPLGYFGKCTEAQAALDDYNSRRAAGTATAPDKLSMTVLDIYELWSSREYRKSKAAVVNGYKSSWNKRVSRYAGRKMRDMTLDDWQAILDEDEEEGRSQSLIDKDVMLMHALGAFAMERDIITKDYTAFLDTPRVGAKKEKGVFNDLQIKKLEELSSSGFPYADTVLILCYTGFRISELLSLTPFSYHPDENYLQGGMKTAAGKNRIIPVHSKIKPYLLSWLKKGGQTIICDKNGAPIHYSFYLAKIFQPIAELLGLPQATPHWCRHTFTTRAKIAGVDTLALKRILGHANENTTDHYTHTDINWLASELKKVS